MKKLNVHVHRLIFIGCFFLIGLSGTVAQDIQTAANYMRQMSERYEEIEDYIARIVISSDASGSEEMRGDMYYRHPDLLRIDFTQPQEQVLVTDGSRLTLYIPGLDVTMEQSLSSRQQDDKITALATREGLGMLRRLYNVSYVEGPEPIPLEEDSSEMVVKLRLQWRNPSEGFREISLSVDEDLLIRRMVGTTVNYDEVTLDFIDVEVNQNIPVSQFEYRSPPSANRFRNFLFGETN